MVTRLPPLSFWTPRQKWSLETDCSMYLPSLVGRILQRWSGPQLNSASVALNPIFEKLAVRQSPVQQFLMMNSFSLSDWPSQTSMIQRWLPHPLYRYCTSAVPSLCECSGTSSTSFEKSEWKAESSLKTDDVSGQGRNSHRQMWRVWSMDETLTFSLMAEAESTSAGLRAGRIQQQVTSLIFSASSKVHIWVFFKRPFSILTSCLPSVEESTSPLLICTISNQSFLMSAMIHIWSGMSWLMSVVRSWKEAERQRPVFLLMILQTVPLTKLWVSPNINKILKLQDKQAMNESKPQYAFG